MTSEEKNRIELAAELYAQGRRDGWLAALAAVEAQMPGVYTEGEGRAWNYGRGRNEARKMMLERIAALKETTK